MTHACSLKTACNTGKQVPVPVWRARHWETALREQGVQDTELASRMQHHFDQARIVLFQFEPGVKVGVLLMLCSSDWAWILLLLLYRSFCTFNCACRLQNDMQVCLQYESCKIA